jgi:hypothetical protein
MAERVIDVLEPVEVDDEHRAAALTVRGVAKRFLDRPANPRAS